MKKTTGFAVMACTVMMLLTVMPVGASDPNPGRMNTDVIVTNTNQDVSAPATNVRALYYSQGGVMEISRPRSIASRGSYGFKTADAQLGDNWRGSMVVQSDTELAVVAEIHRTGGSFGDKKEADAYTGLAQGAGEFYFPFVVWAPNAQYTVVTIQNTEDTAAPIEMTYINTSGVVDFANVPSTLPPFGSRSYAMNRPGVDGVPNLAGTSYFAQKGNWGGAVTVRARNGKKITAVASNHWQQWSVVYNGLTQGATQSTIPSAERRVDAVQGWRGFSVIVVQCVSTSPCTVALDFVNAATGQTSLTLTRTVNPGASVTANTRSGGEFDPNQIAAALGNVWVGSVLARSTNNTKLAVIAYSIRPASNQAGGTSAATIQDAGRETILPVVYQKNTQNRSCPTSDSAWTAFSIVRIQNPGATNATDVDISYYNQDGSIAFQEQNWQIQAGKSLSRHTRVDCGAIPLNGNWVGSVYVRSDQPLVAVVENLWGSLEMAGYNGYSVNR